MRAIACVLLGLGPAACAANAGAGVTASAPTLRTGKEVTPPQSAPQVARTCPSWRVHAVRREKTATVASCQVAPIDLASDLTAEVRPAWPTRFEVRVVEDRETGDGLSPFAVLASRSYAVDVTGTEIVVHDAKGAAVDEDEARRIRALVATRQRRPGADAAGLRQAVEAVADVRLRGSPAQEVSTSVQPASAQGFGVQVDASESDAGMCHLWATTAHLAGDLTMHPGDAVVDALVLRGPTATTEALCEGARQSGASAAPVTCTRGEIAIAIDVSCAPGD